MVWGRTNVLFLKDVYPFRPIQIFHFDSPSTLTLTPFTLFHSISSYNKKVPGNASFTSHLHGKGGGRGFSCGLLKTNLPLFPTFQGRSVTNGHSMVLVDLHFSFLVIYGFDAKKRKCVKRLIFFSFFYGKGMMERCLIILIVKKCPGNRPFRERDVRIWDVTLDSIGIEILKRLGWRPGQGIGPRRKKQGANAKVYGCSLPESESLSPDDDPFMLSYTFAPEDTNEVVYKPKDDCFGLGYIGLSKQSVLSARFDKDNPTATKSFLKKDKRKIAITGQAFGVGAFEDDDEDVYSKDDMSQYDFSDFDPESDQTSSKSGKHTFKKYPDGVIEGFRLASQPCVLQKYYPPPKLPPDFIPKFSKLLSQSKSHSKDSIQQYYRTSSVTERAFLLGENKFQSIQLKTPAQPVKENKLEVSVPPNELRITTSKNTFKPFVNDVMKQKRYEEFLKLKDSGELDKLVSPSSMTEWEKQQEIEEFHRASLLFRPLSGMLSSKFESRSHLSVEHEVMDAIEKAKHEKSLKSSSTVKKLVGLKNRVVSDWYPSSLLCKRFNVPNPYPNSTPSGTATPQQSKSIFDHITTPNITVDTNTSEVLSSTPQKEMSVEESSDMLLDPVKKSGQPQQNIDSIHKTDEKVNIETSQDEIVKPSMDFFKAIFENSSSDDEDISEMDTKQTESTEKAETDKVIPSNTLTEDISKANSLENKNLPKKSGFGVFANLDLDALNQRNLPKKDELIVEEKPTTNSTNNALNNDKDVSNETKTKEAQQDDIYGPALPPNYSELSEGSSLKYQSKKHKLKHKHKHHKNKVQKTAEENVICTRIVYLCTLCKYFCF
nr:G patch domain-containing protein 1 isoform X2 [Parasteatoda tepidariorum]